jgi:ATP-dependent Clp protease ATP-binding subunit ClpB
MASNQQYTEKARDAIVEGQKLTEQRKLAQYEPEVLLYTLVNQDDGVVPQILQRLGGTAHRARAEAAVQL